MSGQIRLQNNHVAGGILVDARYSGGDIPFCKLQHVAGFPRMLLYKQPIEIDPLNFSEILYRLEDNAVRASGRFHPRLYRIKVPTDNRVVEADVLD